MPSKMRFLVIQIAVFINIFGWVGC